MKKFYTSCDQWLKTVLLVFVLTFILVSKAVSAWKPEPAFNLAEVGEFAVFMLGKPSSDLEDTAKLDLSSVTIFGDVAVGPHGEFDFQGPATVNGDLYLDPTLSRVISNVGTLNGKRYVKDLAHLVEVALATSAFWAAYPSDQQVKTLVESLTIQGKSGLNVISIRSLDYRKSTTSSPLQLILKGPAEDPSSALFVVNIAQKLDMGGGAVIRSDAPSRLLVNVLPGLTPVRLASQSYIGGTLLAIDRKMGPLSGTTGPLIGAQLREISLLGGAAVNPLLQGKGPIAVILGPATGVFTGDRVQLDGSASTSADSQNQLSFNWSFVSKPSGSSAAFSDNHSVSTNFIADLAGEYLVELVVSDGTSLSEPARLLIAATQEGLEADLALQISADPSRVYLNSPLTLKLLVSNLGSGSTDSIFLKATLLGRTDTVALNNSSCFHAAGEIECALDPLAPGQNHEVQVYVAPTKQPNFDISARVTAPGILDPDLDNNEGYLRVKVLKLNQ
jgi:hypothetical protein